MRGFMGKMKRSCKNCAVLKILHKMGRDCEKRVELKYTVCFLWVDGHCRNNLKVKVTG